jgi:hypothetical protein
VNSIVIIRSGRGRLRSSLLRHNDNDGKETRSLKLIEVAMKVNPNRMETIVKRCRILLHT